MSTPSVHIEALSADEIAKTVIMPGDPLRAKFIADNFLTDVTCFNKVRNMLGFTGYYKGKKISVMASGMGCASIGIYSYELFKFYDVDNIVRIGSCGSYVPECKVYDLLLVKSAYSDSSFAKVANNDDSSVIMSSTELNIMLKQSANKLHKEIKEVTAYTTDVFYSNIVKFEDMVRLHNCSCVEMEAFALFTNANILSKRAACLLTVSDSFVTKESLNHIERQNSFFNMMEVALNI
jgi:purine-nucleoside phosphorylase